MSEERDNKSAIDAVLKNIEKNIEQRRDNPDSSDANRYQISRVFTLTKKEEEIINDWWLNEHDSECKFSAQNNNGRILGCVGGALTYSFTPTYIGQIIEASCVCGQGEFKIDLTDYERL